VVAMLGKLPGLDDEERVGWEEIGRILDAKPRPHPDLFLPHPDPPVWATVDLSRVTLELAWEAIARLKMTNRRAAKLFDITATEITNPADARKNKLHMAYVRREHRRNWAQMTEGIYLLRTNLKAHDSEQLWKAYIQLTQAEAAFRTLKSDLAIRPIFHQRSVRVKAHIMVCFLALAMYKTLEQWMDASGLGNAPRKLIEELREVVQLDVLMSRIRGRGIRLRLVSRPEQRLRILLDKLGLPLPNRPKNITKCSGDF